MIIAEELIEKRIQVLTPFVSEARRGLIAQIVEKRSRYLCTVLENIYQPHNAAAVLRSCDSFGVQDVHHIETTNIFTPAKTVSMGAEKWLTPWLWKGSDGLISCVRHLRKENYALVATSPHAEQFTPDSLPLDRPIALFFGAEKPGLSEDALNMCDYTLRIPMHGFVESLNISVSAALCLYRLGDRIRKECEAWSLSDSEKRALILDWYRKSVKGWEQIEERYVHESA